MTGCYFAFCDETERTTSEIMVVNFGRYFVRSVEMPKKGKCIGQQRPAVYLVLPECSFFIFLQCQLKRELSAGLPCLRLSHLRLQVGTLVITLNVLHPAGCRRQVADRDCGPSEV